MKKYRNSIIICMTMILVLLLLVYKDYFKTLFTFRLDASDLAGIDAEGIKQNVLHSHSNLQFLLWNLGFFSSFVIPIAIVFIGYEYSSLKDKYLKLSIGKSGKYGHRLNRLKLMLASFLSFSYVILFGIVILLTVINKNAAISEYSFFGLASEKSILAPFVNTAFGFVAIQLILLYAAIFVNSIVMFYIIDIVHDPLRSSLVFLGVIWLSSIALYRFLPYWLVPMTTIMRFSYNDLALPTILAPYVPYAIAVLCMRRIPKTI